MRPALAQKVRVALLQLVERTGPNSSSWCMAPWAARDCTEQVAFILAALDDRSALIDAVGSGALTPNRGRELLLALEGDPVPPIQQRAKAWEDVSAALAEVVPEWASGGGEHDSGSERAVAAIRAIAAAAGRSTPWKSAQLSGWSIVGMNHYHVAGEPARRLFVAMTSGANCVQVEGPDDDMLWERLSAAAARADAEPHPIELCAELRRACGLFDGAMPKSPKEAWDEAIARVRALAERTVV